MPSVVNAERDAEIYRKFIEKSESTNLQSPLIHQILADDYGLSPSRVRHIISEVRKHYPQSPENIDQSITSETTELPRPPVPSGFFVRRLNTHVDEDGETQEQWLQADRQSKRTVEIQDSIPVGHRTKGISTYIDGEGRVRAQWIKTNREQEQWEEIICAILDYIPSIITPLPPVQRTALQSNNLLALYPLADLHIGLYASLQDAEGDWSLRDSVELIKRCIDDLIARTPMAALAVLANLGDFTHIDNLINRTPNSGAPLDTDGRFVEIAQAAMELAVYAIESIARHHGNVIVIWQSGNHDEATALVLQTALATLYRNDSRVHVHQSGKRTHVLRHGQVALGFTHGDTIKSQALPLLMANDYSDIWAATRYRVWHCGHRHHKETDEYAGCIVETHQSPVPRDAWHEKFGYRSLHSMCSIVYDEIGEYARNTIQIRLPDNN
jgi:hypothetical protein